MKLSSTRRMFVPTQSAGAIRVWQRGSNFTCARVSTYVKLARMPSVINPAIDEVGPEHAMAGDLAAPHPDDLESTFARSPRKGRKG